MFEFIQQLIEAAEKKEKTKKPKKKSMASDDAAAAVYHRDYIKTRNKSYRTEQ
jgi:hypothetical protein